jgi:lysozyme family protein
VVAAAQVSPAFLDALAKTLAHEGGLSDHPLDAGGRTNMGITQRTYDTYRRTSGESARAVDDMTDREMREIYHDNYWLPCHCDDLPPPLARAVFDMAVNSGPWNAKLTLQRALRVKADGVIGPVTVAAAKHASVLPFLKKRAGFIQEIIADKPSQVAFLEGWINRLLDQAWNP